MIVNANALHLPFADQSAHCCVTSPPYYGLRDYGVPGQLGLEQSPEEYIANMVSVFREVWRVLRDDGTLWLNVGDSYATSPNGRSARETKAAGRDDRTFRDKPFSTIGAFGSKPKELLGVPWLLAFALRADGWYLRSDIIWSKPNPMPESVTDRPTKAHEYLFLLTKQPRYYFDQEAVREPFLESGIKRQLQGRDNSWGRIREADPRDKRDNGDDYPAEALDLTRGRNIRTVWEIATQPTPYAHFATFPEKLVEPCIKAGTSERGVCPVCGAPWVRVVESKSLNAWVDRKKNGAGRGSKERGYNENHGIGMSHDLGSIVTTTGWRSTCAHEAEPVQAIVLDPFSGSGTTGRVALRLGRRFVGTELNYQYISEIAPKRMTVQIGIGGIG